MDISVAIRRSPGIPTIQISVFSPTIRFNSNLLNESNTGRARLLPSRGGPNPGSFRTGEANRPSAGPRFLPSRRQSILRQTRERGRLVRTGGPNHLDSAQAKPSGRPQDLRDGVQPGRPGGLRNSRQECLRYTVAAVVGSWAPTPPTTSILS
jgi:hypothetical protein